MHLSARLQHNIVGQGKHLGMWNMFSVIIFIIVVVIVMIIGVQVAHPLSMHGMSSNLISARPVLVALDLPKRFRVHPR
jgi:hypothetical protein